MCSLTRTSASWLNMVERFFRDLTENRIHRGVFRDVEELINAIDECVDRHNESPKKGKRAKEELLRGRSA